MLYGIDISNHQKGLQLSTSDADLYEKLGAEYEIVQYVVNDILK